MNDFIKQKIDAIAECIFHKIEKSTEDLSYGLYSGEFGSLLFLFYYSSYTKNERHRLQTESYAEKLFNQFLHKSNLHTFSGGFSGIFYLFEFLREKNFIDIDVSDSQPLLDNYLISRMRIDIQQQNYDFMHGALGVGLYFLKKGSNTQCIQELINFLYQTAEKDIDEQILKWKSAINYETNLIGYNLSLCHGISSIIIFLSRVVNSNIKDERIIQMLYGAVRYLLSQQKDFKQFGSYFPSYSLINSQEPPTKSRLAWCYGDLGTGLALWQAGKTINHKEWINKGLEILLESTKRRTLPDTFVLDGGICHGSAGVALIYRRMYLETKIDTFKEASDFWVRQTLCFSGFEDGLAGFKTKFKDGWKCDYSFLEGVTGIGLVLLSYITDDMQSWDEILLLSQN